MVPLDHLTGAIQLSYVQTAGDMAKEVLQLVDVVKTELKAA